MTDLLERTTTSQRSSAGVAGPSVRAKRQAKTPTIALGVLVAVICGLAAMWLVASAGETSTALAFASDVERGQVITAQDLTTTEVGGDQVGMMTREQADQVVGQVALVDLSAGTLVTPDLVAEAGLVPAGQVIVGLDLTSGQAPSLQLTPGVTVTVFLTPSPNSDLATAEDAAAAGDVLAETATVVEVTPTGQAGQMFVALAVDADVARGVNSAAALGRVRLAQVEAGE